MICNSCIARSRVPASLQKWDVLVNLVGGSGEALLRDDILPERRRRRDIVEAQIRTKDVAVAAAALRPGRDDEHRAVQLLPEQPGLLGGGVLRRPPGQDHQRLLRAGSAEVLELVVYARDHFLHGA
jgi:hypothetical protein